MSSSSTPTAPRSAERKPSTSRRLPSLADMLRPAASPVPSTKAPAGSGSSSRAPSKVSKGRRSDLHAKEVNQIRSESRAGFSRGTSASPSSDRARTETHGPPKMSGQRAGSSSPLPSHSKERHGNVSGGDSGAATDTSEARTVGRREDDGLLFPRGPSRTEASSRANARAPLPDEFLNGRTESVAGSRNDRPALDDEQDLASHPYQNGSAARRRYASDAQASEMPTYGYEGRTRNGGPRLSIDTGSNQRHLAAALRSRTTSGPNEGQSAAHSNRARLQHQPNAEPAGWNDSASSQSDFHRTRKGSQASSAGNARARPSSRLSSAYRSGGDVFDDSVRSPLMLSRMLRPDLPPEALDRVKALQLRKEALQVGLLPVKDKYGPAVDDLRAQIEDFDVRGSTIPSSSHSSSGVSSAPRPRPAHPSHADRLLAQARQGPASEPRRVGDLRKDRPTMPPSVNGLSEDRAMSGRVPHATEPLRRFASQAAFDRTPSTPDVAYRPHSRFSTLSRGVTPGPVLNSTSSAASRAATTPRERNLLTSFEIFERHFAGTGTPASPSSTRHDSADSFEVVDRARTFVDTVTTLNAGLRDAAKYVIQCQITSEVEGDTSASTTALKDLDQALASLMKLSDNQVRNLGEFLSTVTRMDKDRARARSATTGRLTSDVDHSSFGARSESRLSSAQGSQWSPSRRGDVRRGATIGGHAKVHQHSIDSALSAIGRPMTSLRREMRDVRQAASAVDDYESASAYSGQRATGGLGLHSQVGDDPSISPTMSVGAIQRLRSSAHGRSVSELSPGRLSPTRSPRDSVTAGAVTGRQQTPRAANATLQRTPTSATRAAAPLSPRRPKLSDPSVATAVAVSSRSHATSDGMFASMDADGHVTPLGDDARASDFRTLPRRQSGSERKLHRRSTMTDSRHSATISPASSATTTAARNKPLSPSHSLADRDSATLRLPGQRASHRYSIAATSIDSVTLPDPAGEETREELYDLYAERSTDRGSRYLLNGAERGSRQNIDPRDFAAPVSSTPPTSARNALRYASQALGRISAGALGSDRRQTANTVSNDSALSSAPRGSGDSAWASTDRQAASADSVEVSSPQEL
ncbi:unnamed protein product [Parajaminaea phylloscopi]